MVMSGGCQGQVANVWLLNVLLTMAAAQGHVLQWPDFTDGDESKWPHHMPSYTRADDAGYALTWKKKLGQVIASVLGLPSALLSE
jgi:hypothetical protein